MINIIETLLKILGKIIELYVKFIQYYIKYPFKCTVIIVCILILLTIIISINKSNQEIENKIKNNYKTKNRNTKSNNNQLIQTNSDFSNYINEQNKQYKTISNNYIKSNLLTDYETNLYKKLDDICTKNNWRITTKTRLADLIKSSTNNYNEFDKISRKHIDFCICEPETLSPLLLIELDDSTHNKENRRARDDFVNQSVVQAGYKILHVRNINEELEQKINEIINVSSPGVFYI